MTLEKRLEERMTDIVRENEVLMDHNIKLRNRLDEIFRDHIHLQMRNEILERIERAGFFKRLKFAFTRKMKI